MKMKKTQNSWRSSYARGEAWIAKLLEVHHPNFAIFYVQELNNNVALPNKNIEKATRYDLCASHNCTTLVGDKGLVKTGFAISLPIGLHA